MSFALHSSIENLGGGRRSGSVGSKSSFKLNWSVKSAIGLMSPKVSASPRSRNHWKESRCTAMRSGSGKTSSILAKEKRSGVRERKGKVYSSRVLIDRETGKSGAWARVKELEVERSFDGRARQPFILHARGRARKGHANLPRE